MSRPRLAGAVLLAIALVACGGSSKSNQAASTDSGGEQTTIVIGPDGSSSVVVVPNDTTPGDGTAPATVGPPGSAAIDPTGPPGSFAPAILQPAQSNEVVVEVRTQSGAAPQQSSLDHVVAVLRSVTGKTVNVTQGASIGGGAKSWSADELRSTGGAGAAQGGGRTVIHLLFVHGDFGGDSGVLGVAVRGDTAAVFVDQVSSASTPLVGSAGIEVAAVTHEVGHLMGLVDLFLHTGRQDPDHPGHSTNPKSVMYWAVESNLVAQLLNGGPPKDFDSTDLADLKTIHDSA